MSVSVRAWLRWWVVFGGLWWGAAAHAQAPAGGWCVVAGGFRYEAFDQAAGLVARLKAQEVATAALYDTRDFAEMAWGELVVIAQQFSGPEARKEAAAAVKALKGKRVDVYAKPCSSKTAKVLTAAAEIAPRPVLPKEPVVVDPERWPSGCFGWSPQKSVAACVVMQVRSDKELDVMVFPGSEEAPVDLVSKPANDNDETPPTVLSAQDLKGLRTTVRRLGLVSIAAFQRSLGPNETLHYAEPRVSVQWIQKLVSEEREDMGEGGCALYSDRIVLRCRGKSPVEETLFEVSQTTANSSTEVYLLPNQMLLALHATVDCGDEGGSSAESVARLIDLRRLCTP